VSENLQFERLIDAPAAVVFEAFTSPGGQEAFYGQDDPGWIVESVCDLRVGGIWAVTFGPTRTQLYRHRHLIEAIDSPQRLVLATTEFRVDGSRITYTTEFTFADHDGGTLMTMIQTGFPTAELRDEHTRGLPNAFNRLEHFLEQPGQFERRKR
jgi:uncharacterized protein YndB with AHSA1/START domain